MPDDETLDTVEVRRFAESLETLEAGRQLDIDPTEDPELSELVATSVSIADTFTAATETPRFESYRLRSRAAILHQLAATTSSAPEPVSFWHRRWMSFAAPVASAAAAAAITLAFVIATDSPAPPPEANADPQVESAAPLDGLPSGDPDLVASSSIVDRLESITIKLEELERRNNNGELVSADFLRALTEQHATVAADIADAEPGSLADGVAVTAFTTTINSKTILENAKTDEASEGALEAARQQSEQARKVAEDYLVATQFNVTADQSPELPAPSSEQGDAPIEFEGAERF